MSKWTTADATIGEPFDLSTVAPSERARVAEARANAAAAAAESGTKTIGLVAFTGVYRIRRRIGSVWVQVWVVERRGRLVASQVEVWPVREGGAIRSSDLRAISIRDAIQAAATEDSGLLRLSRASRRRISKPPKARRQGRAEADPHYAEVAGTYLRLAHDPSTRRRINVALAEEFRRRGWGDADAPWARDQARLARRYGWLTPSRKGVSGAEATPKLKTWLKDREER